MHDCAVAATAMWSATCNIDATIQLCLHMSRSLGIGKVRCSHALQMMRCFAVSEQAAQDLALFAHKDSTKSQARPTLQSWWDGARRQAGIEVI